MTTWICPHGCTSNTDTPFYYTASQVNAVSDAKTELGVLCYSDLSPSNRWEDGVIGVQREIRDALALGDDFPLCIKCKAEVVASPSPKID